MKFVHYILVLLIIFSEAHLKDPKPRSLYFKQGADWDGLCNTGKMQSPINIVDKGNTADDQSYIIINYKMKEKVLAKKFFFDGERLYMDINLGTIEFFNRQGSQETYEMKRIELHMPAEHYLTKNGQTQIHALEIHIAHDLVSTNNAKITSKVLPVKQATLAILYTVGDKEFGDVFLEQMGVSQFNIDDKEAKFDTPSRDQYLDRKLKLRASFGVGFNYLAFQGLLNDINADQHLYFYYGSETFPPCKEEMLWMVFANPRSISKFQFDYLILTLVKNYESGKKIIDANNPNQLYGNKRKVILFEEFDRPKILSNARGLKHVNNHNFFESKKNTTEILS